MLGNLRLIAGTVLATVVFGIGAYLGYHFGGRKVDQLEKELKQITDASNAANAKLKSSQDELSKIVSGNEAEFAKRSEQLRKEAEIQARQLKTALAGADARNKTLQERISTINTSADAIRAKLASDIRTESAAERKALQDKLAALETERKSLAAQVLGNQCLVAVVPDAVLKPLMAGAGSGLKLSLALSAPGERIYPLAALSR